MTIGERIKERRIACDLSVSELADLLGKNRSTIYRYESSEIENLPTDILEPIASALHTSPEYLMGWTDDPTDYNDPDLIASIPKPILEHFDGDVRKAKRAQDAIYEDGAKESGESFNYIFPEDDENLIILNRNAKKLSPENRKKLLEMAKLMFKEEFDDE